MSMWKTMPVATIFAAFASSPAFALASWLPPGPGDGMASHSAPGPILGIGLPAAAVVGGYVWLRRRARNRTRR